MGTHARNLQTPSIVPSAALLRLGVALRATVWALYASRPRQIRVNIDTTVSTVYAAIQGTRKRHNIKHQGQVELRPVLWVLTETRTGGTSFYLCR
jgi:hypothetical protein